MSRSLPASELGCALSSFPVISAPPIEREEVIRLRNLYRIFWERQGTRENLKASVFMGLLGPDPRAMESPVGTISPEKLKDRDIFPRRDYTRSALRMDWETGRLRIAARGPIDFLTHAAFQHRQRLRTCGACQRLFVAFGPRELLCSTACKRENKLASKNKWWGENRKAMAARAS
jgi:hypothetical protein